MNYYVYNADVYCEKCAADIVANIRRETNTPHGYVKESYEWPQGPFSNDEADTPQHCGSGEDCLDPTTLPDGEIVGQFLENNLTTEGRDYALEQHAKHSTAVTTLWMDYYGLWPFYDSCDEITDEDPA